MKGFTLLSNVAYPSPESFVPCVTRLFVPDVNVIVPVPEATLNTTSFGFNWYPSGDLISLILWVPEAKPVIVISPLPFVVKSSVEPFGNVWRNTAPLTGVEVPACTFLMSNLMTFSLTVGWLYVETYWSFPFASIFLTNTSLLIKYPVGAFVSWIVIVPTGIVAIFPNI